MASLVAARAAKASLRQRLAGQPWLRGIGIAQLKCLGPDPYELQVNLDRIESQVHVPRSWMGVPVTISVVGDIIPLSGTTPLAAQDWANGTLGILCLVGTFMVGKIAVDNIIQSRKEHFDRKGQPPAAVKAKETTLDGMIKLAASAFSVYQITQQFPEVVKEARKYLQ